jgi:peptidoglycan/LPS O-acetylase OafA/YrhL
MSAARRFETLDAIRGVAAIAVMLHHVTQHTARPIFAGAGLAVDLFFCLSGFVIAHSYLDRLQAGMTLGEFVERRLVRLYPMYLIGFALGAMALMLESYLGQSGLSGTQAQAAIALNLFYLPYLVSGSPELSIFPTNAPAWSLFFEVAINIVFAVWAIRGRAKGALLLAVLGAVLLAVSTRYSWQREPGWSNLNFLGGIPRTFLGFFMGVVLYRLHRGHADRFMRIDPAWILASLVIAFAVPNLGARSILLWLGSAILLVPLWVSLGINSEPASATARQIFGYVGWLSYPIYCLHVPIYHLLNIAAGRQLNEFVVSALAIATSFITAHVATKYVEEPSRSRLQAALR